MPTPEDKPRILVAEDEEIARENLIHMLTREGYEARGVPDGAQAVELLEREEFDLVLTDLRMQGVDGLGVLEAAKRLRPGSEVIILTGYATVENAVEALQQGAYHYLAKPYKLSELRSLVSQALEKVTLRRQVAELRQQMEDASTPLIIGQAPAMVQLRETIKHVAGVDSSVLILGETGTGKGLAARAIHALSGRRNQRFLAVNCAAFTEELLANELFGHEREAFTGASRRKKGLMELADGGTFFLDEIGDMPLPMQAKLLRVLEEKKLMRVGGTEEIPVDIRLIAATNRDLKRAVAEGRFRSDLFYRLNVVSLQLPNLAERREDIPLLVAHFIGKYSRAMDKQVEGVSPEVMTILKDYQYPGNVRELENIVESAMVMCNGPRIQVGHLPPDLQAQSAWLRRPEENEPVSLRENERRHIARVLEYTDSNRTQAAQLLGIDRASLWRKMKRFGLAE